MTQGTNRVPISQSIYASLSARMGSVSAQMAEVDLDVTDIVENGYTKYYNSFVNAYC